MRKLLYFISAILLCTIASCNIQPKPSESQDSLQVTDTAYAESLDSIKFKSVEASDTISIGNVHIKVSAMIPYAVEGESYLVDSINNWVRQSMFENIDHPTEKTQDIKSIVKSFSKESLNEFIGIAEESSNEDYVKEYGMCLENDLYIIVSYEDSDYITLTLTHYYNGGGAHGFASETPQTFDKHTGRKCGWELLADMTEEQIIDSIKADFDDYIIESIKDYLNLSDEDDFPLPATIPYITDEGISVIYQQYEITPYSEGMPVAVVRKKK